MKQPLIVGLMLLAGFVLAVSAASLYAQEEIMSGTACACNFPIYFLIPLLSSAGLLVGSAIYYTMSKHMGALSDRKDYSSVLKFLDHGERSVVSELIRNGGSLTQAKLVSSTGLNKVKVSRLVSSLESKGIVKKESMGITNQVGLADDLKRLFCR
ncbi:MAG: hypothetical protein JXB14_04675 [Candidatus Altiarchaeota archaeon]|nr:hypothetical protein [Candidatus Altiarchaeota archaeon]